MYIQQAKTQTTTTNKQHKPNKHTTTKTKQQNPQ